MKTLFAAANLFVMVSTSLSLSVTAQAAELPKTNVVSMKSLSFDPKEIRIIVGETVTWKNVAYTDHSATSIDTPPVFDTGVIAPGKESRPVHFDKAGSFYYNCSIHGKTMSGVVTVTAAKK